MNMKKGPGPNKKLQNHNNNNNNNNNNNHTFDALQNKIPHPSDFCMYQ
jgi:hypothetical protein